MTKATYDTDFDAWLQAQAAALRAKTWDALDVEHLAEEIEDLRKRERNAVRGHLRILLLHRLHPDRLVGQPGDHDDRPPRCPGLRGC